MSDNPSPLPWGPQQWAALRSVVQEAAEKSRVASKFLPVEKGAARGDQTVPANWMNLDLIEDGGRQRGEAHERLQVRSGKTLQLTTISCKVYLRGSDVADPELHTAKSMVRRAAEVLARLEDAIVFNGVPKQQNTAPTHNGRPIVEPPIYQVSGGRDLTGVLQAPDTFWDLMVTQHVRRHGSSEKRGLKGIWAALREAKDGHRYAMDTIEKIKEKSAAVKDDSILQRLRKQQQLAEESLTELVWEQDRLRALVNGKDDNDILCVQVQDPTEKSTMPVVDAVIQAVQKLERQGHFGPFAAVLGDTLFREATSPSGSASVLPSQSILPFLQGGDLYRSSTIPEKDGIVIALGGEPVELVVGTDMDVKFLQVTLEPRYVLRVYERFVLRIKELDAVCRITRDPSCLDENFVPRKANA